MSRLKVDHGTLTLPRKLRRAPEVEDDGYLEALPVEGGVLLKPVSERDPAVEAAIAEGLEDVEAGRMYGPFESVEEMKEYFKKHPLAMIDEAMSVQIDKSYYETPAYGYAGNNPRPPSEEQTQAARRYDFGEALDAVGDFQGAMDRCREDMANDGLRAVPAIMRAE